MDSPTFAAQVMSKKVLKTRASRMPLQQITSSLDEIMHSKEKKVHKIQNDPYLIEFVVYVEFTHVPKAKGCQKAASECKPSPVSKDL